MWLSSGPSIWQYSGTTIAHAYALRDKIANVVAFAPQCDGSLLAAEDDGPLVRFSPDGTYDRYDVQFPQIDTLVRGTDCRIWYAAGSNAPAQAFGTVSFHR